MGLILPSANLLPWKTLRMVSAITELKMQRKEVDESGYVTCAAGCGGVLLFRSPSQHLCWSTIWHHGSSHYARFPFTPG